MSTLVHYEQGVLVPTSGDDAAGPGGLVPWSGGSLVRADGEVPPEPSPPRDRPNRLAIAVIVASLVGAVAVGAAAFGSGSGGGGSSANPARSARGDLAASASSSSAAHSAAFTVSATEQSPGTTATFLTGSGAFDLDSGVGKVTATIPVMSTLTGGGVDGSVTVLSDGSNLFLDAPSLSILTGGKHWVEASVARLASTSGSPGASVPLSALANPSEILGLLHSLGSTVTRVGTVPLDGTPATEYRTNISLAGAASHLAGGSADSSAHGLAQALARLGDVSVPVTAWVGGDGRIRQVSLAVDLSHATIGSILGGSNASSSSAASSLALTVGFSRYGQPVSVAVPPASDVTNLNNIVSSARGAASRLGGALTALISRV